MIRRISLVLIMMHNTLGWWTNFPYNCTPTVDENPNIKCGYDNYHYSLKDVNSYKNLINMGKVCVYKPGLSNKLDGFVCKKIVKYTSCYQNAEGNNHITYKTDLEEVTKRECELMLKKRIEFGYDQRMFYPPAKCSFLTNTTSEAIFFIIDEVKIYDDPLKVQQHRLYEVSGKIMDDVRLVGVKPWSSEQCQVEKWDCIDSKTDIFLDMIKPGNWINLHFIFLQFQLLYEHTFGIMKFRSVCKIKFCGKYMLYKKNFKLFHIENEDMLEKFEKCEEGDSIRLIHNNGGIENELGVNAIKFKLEDKERYCEEMKSKLENSGTVNYNNMHYLSPIYPGLGPGYALKEYLSASGSLLTGKLIKQNKLNFYSCTYWPTEFRTYNDSGKKILFHRRMGESTFTSDEPDLLWSYEKPITNEIMSENGKKIKFGINGILSNNGTLLIPNSRILSIMLKNSDAPLNQTLSVKDNGKKKIRVEELLEFSEIIEQVKEEGKNTTDKKITQDGDDYDNYTSGVSMIGKDDGEGFNLSKINDNIKYPKRNITIMKNKNIVDGFDLDVTTWGVFTLSSTVILYISYRKLREYKKRKGINNK
ncbi:GNS gene product [Kotonkan virus]|uniref:Non-structural transmembrane glycoprotein n=1 Tax=Kotonkan virus TaxID=318836 RepID=H8XWF4_9RHAB|nr:GNS gene product [Kotonkan virus]AEI17634.1 non-structural transmembrane glycoprotein [Kotonkan virus]